MCPVIEQAPGGEVTAVNKTYAVPLSNGSNQDYWAKLLNLYTALGIPRHGQMLNGKISPFVASGDLVLSLLTASGTIPSADDPVYINIGGTVRKVTAATTTTLSFGTNWMNLGAAEFATLEQDLFAYAIWDSGDSVVRVSPARIPYGRLVSDFNNTTTNERHLSGYSGFAATDEVCVIGRFAATLSAGAAYTWSVPAYTHSNLRQEPIYETRLLEYNPQWTASVNPAIGDGVLLGRYRVRHQEVLTRIHMVMGASTTYGTGSYTWSAPFTSITLTSWAFIGTIRILDNSATTNYIGATSLASGTSSIAAHTHGAANTSGLVPITLAQSDQIRIMTEFPIT